MSLPYSTPDLEDGFASSTPFRNRIFDRPSGSSSAFNWNPDTTMPPPKDKGKGKASEIRDTTEEDSDAGNPTPQTHNLPPLTGYGIHNTQNAAEPVYNRQQQQPANQEQAYQQPIPQVAPRIIKEPGLFYDGENFGKFLMQFERAARAFNASDYDKALQIGRFMKTEDLKTRDGRLASGYPAAFSGHLCIRICIRTRWRVSVGRSGYPSGYPRIPAL
ncbi:hypothetical protein PGTUg99_012639 [Puccinia graminis f. sp. tritici]|uniref:Uncharacterized protein n=1 Tax=Puccinia graminis f. sp. tritici TaxID=56615 RepID=A0A5B0RCX7_PUCGR|nr:hypothetical protein PGTUg99_012639 [Puccinia graminis f. sp. tritici]